MELTDSTIKQATDPLVISPTFIDEVTIKKKHQDEELVSTTVQFVDYLKGHWTSITSIFLYLIP